MKADSRMAGSKRENPAKTPNASNRTLVLFFIAAVLLAVGLVFPYALPCVFFDGLAAAMVVVPAALAGLWLVPLFGAGRMPLRWHLLIGTALGLGAQSLLVLLLGLAGAVQRSVWIVLLGVFAIAGAARLWSLLREHRANRAPEGTANKGNPFRYLWLIACPFLILALLAASNPPGFIWKEEGYGYDVLEYHLQLPKEYLHAGRIEYVPHNVYANFPANVEMQYLLAMILLDDTADAGVAANMIHLAFAVLAVLAAWVIGRDWSPQAGIIAGLAAATAGWLVYLSGLAYVENGLLFYGLAATGVLLRSPQQGASGQSRDLALPGVIAGFACGCKYTAVAMIALPLALAVLWLPYRSLQRRILGGLVFTSAALVTFSPWLIKNTTMTSNPVFPLANGLFHASPPGWGIEETRRWDHGHSAASNEPMKPDTDAVVQAGPVGRIVKQVGTKVHALWRHIVGDKDQRFGPLVILLALGGLLRRKLERADGVLLAVLLVQLVVWLFATHLYARFAVVLLIPLALLAGRAVLGANGVARRRIVVVLFIVGSLWNLAFAVRLGRAQAWDSAGAPASLIYNGKLEGFEYFQVVNNELPPDAKVLLVGDAKAFYFQRDVDYCVVFNRSPFVEAVQAAESDRQIINWLQARGYTHVLVNWAEVNRLTRTYGFAEDITPDLFDRLVAAGLSPLAEFKHPQIRGPYAELYEVPASG